MILVTGATGTVGREVVAQLIALGQPVRALTRDPRRAKFDSRVEVVEGDLEKAETVARALEGVERVFSLALGPNGPHLEGGLARAAKVSGTRHLVKLSSLGVGEETHNAIAQWHGAAESAVKDAGIDWTFVRPGSFMSNALFWAGTVKSQGKVFSPFGDGVYPPIHPRDIAAVAVKALTSPGHAGKIYRLTGPKALSVGDQVRLLCEAVGRPIEYVKISDEVARDGMVRAGLPVVLVDALIQVGIVIRSGRAADVLPTVEEVTGRPPLTFADWARENAGAFR
jgi:(4-alkanoyl-5-oxo-2,5-dihydrofuran-3-yl)methyl phosphate reductase